MSKIKKRQDSLIGTTREIKTGVGTAWITVNYSEDQPFEVFVNISKAGSDIQADAEAIGRLLSLILRMPDGLTGIERLSEAAAQMRHIGGARPLGDVRSLPDGIAKELERHVEVDNGSLA